MTRVTDAGLALKNHHLDGPTAREAKVTESALEAKLRELDELQRDPNISREEFARKIETELKPLWEQELRAHGALEPDWEPLHKVLPLRWCDGFGFMGYEGEIRIYKQGFTRQCLYLDPAGNAYEPQRNSFRRVPVKFAIEQVFDGIEEMGFERSTPYNKKNAEKRRKKIEKETGYKILSLGGPDH